MRRLLLALAVVVGLVVPNEAFLVGALKFANGSNQYVLAPASSTLNNVTQVTVLMWASVTTGAPAAQRNFFGKSTGVNQVFGAYNGTTISMQIKDSAGTDAVAVAPFSSWTPIRVNMPMFWVFQGQRTVAANMRVALGSLYVPAAYATSYTSQRVGGGTHDDSGGQLYIGNTGGGGTTNTLPGTIYTFQMFNRIVELNEIRSLQYRWQPRYAGCLLSYRLGASGPANVKDECNNQLHATVSGAPPITGDVIPRVRFLPPGL